jgi:hypothetical protein
MSDLLAFFAPRERQRTRMQYSPDRIAEDDQRLSRSLAPNHSAPLFFLRIGSFGKRRVGQHHQSVNAPEIECRSATAAPAKTSGFDIPGSN